MKLRRNTSYNCWVLSIQFRPQKQSELIETFRGKTFAEIAETETTSKRRIQQMIDLAFLAPDIVRGVLQGKQPLGFTSDWCLRHDVPSDWTEQRRILATL